MDRKSEILELARKKGVIRPLDVKAEGISCQYLYRLVRQGDLARIGRGLYSLPDTLTSEFSSLVEVAKRVPNAVVCLLSSLQFHSLTTQLPSRVWIAIEGTNWKPVIDSPPVRIIRFSGDAFHFGIQRHEIARVSVRIYSPAKTVADCFKFRNKIGLDISLEALRETWKQRKASMDEIWEAATVCRVANVMRPYLEALV